MQATKSEDAASVPPVEPDSDSSGAEPHAARASATAPLRAATRMIFFTRHSCFSSSTGYEVAARAARVVARSTGGPVRCSTRTLATLM
jgi:hypothetical protein